MCMCDMMFPQTYAGTPMEQGMPKEAVDNVLHGTLELSSSCRLMASDSLDKSVVFGDNIAMSMNFATDVQISRAYETLSAEGSVLHPLAEQFWGGEYSIVH